MLFTGILGAITYLYVKGVKETSDFTYRMTLSVIFLIVFINIFIIEGEKIFGIRISNLIVFVGGYSANFVFNLFNKFVEKAMPWK